MILKEMIREHQPVFALPQEATISDAAELMRQEKIGAVVIRDDKRIAGIITDRDIALGLALGASTNESHVTEVMSSDVQTINENMTLVDVTRFFRHAKVKRLPVVNDQDELVSLISTDDILALLAREIFDTCSAMEDKLGHTV